MKAVTIILFILMFSGGCKKDKKIVSDETALSTPPNWNASYIGSYKGDWSYASYNMGSVGPYLHKDSVLIISANSADSSLSTSLSNYPVIKYNLSSSSYPIYFGGISFRNDSLFYSGRRGGLGSGTMEKFKGKKL